jgi:hypothetical protein
MPCKVYTTQFVLIKKFEHEYHELTLILNLHKAICFNQKIEH